MLLTHFIVNKHHSFVELWTSIKLVPVWISIFFISKVHVLHRIWLILHLIGLYPIRPTPQLSHAANVKHRARLGTAGWHVCDTLSGTCRKMTVTVRLKNSTWGLHQAVVDHQNRHDRLKNRGPINQDHIPSGRQAILKHAHDLRKIPIRRILSDISAVTQWLNDRKSDDTFDLLSPCFYLVFTLTVLPNLPSGYLLHSYWKWPSRNSGFSHFHSMVFLTIYRWIFPLKMVI